MLSLGRDQKNPDWEKNKNQLTENHATNNLRVISKDITGR